MQKSDRVLFEPGSKGFLSVQTKLNNYGYDIPKNDVFDRDSQIVVTAFKRHFDSDACTLLKDEDDKPYWKVDLNWTEYDYNMLNALYRLKAASTRYSSSGTLVFDFNASVSICLAE